MCGAILPFFQNTPQYIYFVFINNVLNQMLRPCGTLNYCKTSLIASAIILFTSAIITLNLTSKSKYSLTSLF